MFDVKGLAEIKKLNIRAESHGDEMVPAIDINMLVKNVPVERIDSAVPDIGEHFYDGDHVILGEVLPLVVSHKLENLSVEIGEEVSIKGANLKAGMKIHLQPNKLANVELQVQTQLFDNLASDLSNLLRHDVMVKIRERQLSLVEMEQGDGAAQG